jgi:RNA polymerase sigma-B factor
MLDTAPRTTSAPGGRTTPAAARREPATGDPLPLFERWQRDGDQRAREELVVRFLPLARKLARRYLGANEPVDDLMQVASFGLVKAIDRFDASRGLAFSSFAVPTILGELRRYFRDYGWSVHVPRGAQDRALRVEHALRELTDSSGRGPSAHQLAEYLEWNLSDVLDALEAKAAHHSMSLDAPNRSEEGDTLTVGDSLGTEDERFAFIDDCLSVKKALRLLPLKERRVLQMRFVEDRTQAEIGDRIGVSQMQVSRMQRSALARLRELAEPPA